jgi:hypothetical protein
MVQGISCSGLSCGTRVWILTPRGELYALSFFYLQQYLFLHGKSHEGQVLPFAYWSVGAIPER